MPHHSYIRDGHQLIISVGRGRLVGRIECPSTDSDARCYVLGGCRVIREFESVGLEEFAEWQFLDHRPVDTPCEIEWTISGSGDTYEFFWQPVEVVFSTG